MNDTKAYIFKKHLLLSKFFPGVFLPIWKSKLSINSLFNNQIQHKDIKNCSYFLELAVLRTSWMRRSEQRRYISNLVVDLLNVCEQRTIWKCFSTTSEVDKFSRSKAIGYGPRPSYFDNQATTQIDPRVVDAMLPFMYDAFGNPHSNSHSLGWEANKAIEESRHRVASLIKAHSKEIIFTSGATESNNMVIKGVPQFYGRKPIKSGNKKEQKLKNHIITTQIEHKCLLQACRLLQSSQFEFKNEASYEVTYLPVRSDGLLDLEVLTEALKPNTLLVSVMMVNNEIGVIQNIADIGKICREHGILFHSDAAQAVGKIPIDVESMNIDLMSISAHKLYGPKGVGALYIRQKNPKVRLTPLIDGGGQEKGLRSGTLAPHLVVGLGEACRLCELEMDRDSRRIKGLSTYFWDRLSSIVPFLDLNGSLIHRYPGNLNISFRGVEGEGLLMALKNIAMSSGSACTSASLEPSYVLRALGVGEDVAHTSLRIGFGRFTRKRDVDEAVDSLVREVSRLRELSPVYELEIEAAKNNTQSPDLIWT